MSLRTLMSFSLMSVLFLVVSVQADSIPVANHSFETPVVPFAEPYALPYATGWIEVDNDTDYSANTGVFLNVTNITGTDANQLAFLGSQEGNAFLQDLSATYQVGKSYRLTVGVCVSSQYPPPDPNALAISFYCDDPISDPNTYIQTALQPPQGLSSTALKDYTVYMPTVQAGDAWVGKTVGIALRATGPAGGYWDLDNIRVIEYSLVPEFTGDSFVNLADFSVMAAEWLSCDDPFTDVTGDGCVNEADLLMLVEFWLENV